MSEGEIKLEVGNVSLRFDGCLVHITIRRGDKEVTEMLEHREAMLLGRFLDDANHYWLVIG